MDGEGEKIPCCVAFSVLYPIGKHVFGQISIMFQLGRCGCALDSSAVTGDLKLSSLFLLLAGGGGSVGGGANVFFILSLFHLFSNIPASCFLLLRTREFSPKRECGGDVGYLLIAYTYPRARPLCAAINFTVSPFVPHNTQ